jgi:hypothetical protein
VELAALSDPDLLLKAGTSRTQGVLPAACDFQHLPYRASGIFLRLAAGEPAIILIIARLGRGVAVHVPTACRCRHDQPYAAPSMLRRSRMMKVLRLSPFPLLGFLGCGNMPSDVTARSYAFGASRTERISTDPTP